MQRRNWSRCVTTVSHSSQNSIHLSLGLRPRTGQLVAIDRKWRIQYLNQNGPGNPLTLKISRHLHHLPNSLHVQHAERTALMDPVLSYVLYHRHASIDRRRCRALKTWRFTMQSFTHMYALLLGAPACSQTSICSISCVYHAYYSRSIDCTQLVPGQHHTECHDPISALKKDRGERIVRSLRHL